MGFIFISIMIVMSILLYVAGLSFDRIERGDEIMYYSEKMPVYDIVIDNDGMEITTQLGKVFTFWDLMKGNFLTVKKHKL